MKSFSTLICLLLWLAGYAWSEPMTQSDKNVRTWCVGRFLIDLPAEVKFRGEDIEYDFTNIETQRIGQDAFAEKAALRAAFLKSKKHRSGESMLIFADDVKDITNGKIIVAWDHETSKIFQQIDGFRWVNGIGFVLGGRATPDRQNVAIERRRQLLARLQPRRPDEFRRPDEIPSVPGFCTNQAFIADDGKKNEKVGATFDFKSHPDVVLSIDTNTKADPSASQLVERNAKAVARMGVWAAHVQYLRRGDRNLGLLRGQEVLLKEPGEDGMIGHDFHWETPGQNRSDYPNISIRLETAQQNGAVDGRPASLTDQEAIVLWDAILNTLRLRPTQ